MEEQVTFPKPKREATPEEIEHIRAFRERRVSWVDMAVELGMGRDWCRHVAQAHGFGGPLKEKPPPVPTSTQRRMDAGLAPLREGHPIAMEELERAEGLVF
jgi:hypothetical protein